MYLSTATVLYKNGGFNPDEIEKLRAHTRDMSFDEIYSPGFVYDPSQTDATLDGYVEQIFAGAAGGPPAPGSSDGADASAPADQGADAAPPPGKTDDGVLPATAMGASPGMRSFLANGRRSLRATSSIRARSPTTRPISLPTSRPLTYRGCSTVSNCCRTSGATS